MRISEMTPEQLEEKRKYDRERKRKSRDKQKTTHPLSADEWHDQFPTEQAEALNAYEKQISKTVAEELGQEQFDSLSGEEITISQVSRTLLAFKKNWIRRVHSPSGEMVGTIFADVIGSEIVGASHEYGLEKSKTFSALYRELLQILDARYGETLSRDPVEALSALAIKAELAGTYIPQPVKAIAAPTPAPVESPANAPGAITSVQEAVRNLQRAQVELEQARADSYSRRDVAADGLRYLSGARVPL